MYSKVYVEITNQCNCSCSFCPGTTRAPGMMSLEDFTLVARKLQGVTKYLYYHLMGEPLTHPALPEMLKRAGEMGFRSIITTNGTLLPTRGQALVDRGVHKVNISVHSFEQGTVEKYLEYIQGCMEFADRASAAGTIVVFRLWNEGYDEGRNISTLDLMHRYFPGAWQEGARGIKIRDRVFLEYGQRFSWPDLEAEDQGENVFCYGLRDHFSVLCDGSVVPCCLDHNGDIPLGNLFRQEIGEILSNPLVKEMVDGFSCRRATQELCRRCGYARRFG